MGDMVQLDAECIDGASEMIKHDWSSVVTRRITAVPSHLRTVGLQSHCRPRFEVKYIVGHSVGAHYAPSLPYKGDAV